MTRTLVLSLTLGLVALGLGAQDRTPWSAVSPPAVTSLTIEGQKMVATVEAITGPEGADRLVVELIEGPSGRVLESRALGKTKSPSRSVAFVLGATGTYALRVSALRAGEEPKLVITAPWAFTLPLSPPTVTLRNRGSGTLGVSWPSVTEAEGYRVTWGEPGGVSSARRTTSPSLDLEGLVEGRSYTVVVEALRGTEAVAAPAQTRVVRAQADREWNFTWFGQSTKEGLNSHRVLHADPLKVQLSSATFVNGAVDQKGGKFTTFHDGLSFYYTTIDPRRENFVLTATFTVDQFNPTPDGQEGFGILVLDSLGAPGVSVVNHYTNSAGILATKYEAVVDGVKRTAKDTLGSRMVWGITPEVLAQGDTGIARSGVNVSTAFSYESGDLVTAGAQYTLTLTKTNTGYHAVYRQRGEVVEHTLYDAGRLASLDPDLDYVGFAVARGCNVTVSDVVLTFTDPRTDPPAREEPPTLVPLVARLDSPSASGDPHYPLVFRANADGNLVVTSSQGRWEASVKAGQAWSHPALLARGQNDFTVRFDVDPEYRPGPRARIEPSSTTFVHTVYHRTYPGPILAVSPTGSSLGDGTRAHPLNLATALAFVGPGQTIELADGTYRPRGPVVVERGNDGSPGRPKALRAAPGARPVFDFSFSSGGMVLAGDWWVFEGFDLTSTPGNVKGLQIAGSHNVVRAIEASLCGDTGIQISGSSTEGPDLWPAHNLVVDCASWGHNDPAQNNADGFAAKLTCGPGNVFRGCLAYNNIDDGWDLFSKIETGPIGAVLIEKCVAWGNGRLPDGTGNGDGNGFKLGGDGIAVAHVLRGSLAFANGASGITSNSDPAVVLEANTSYGNRGPNVNLYGKGAGTRQFRAKGTLSMAGGAADVYQEMPELASADNYFWNGAQSINALGQVLGAASFVHTDVGRPPVWDDGRLDLRGLLVPTDRVPPGVGARLQSSSSAR